MDEQRSIMTSEDVAKYLGLKTLTVRRLARDGEIPALKVGRHWRFKKELLDQWIVDQSAKNADWISKAGE